MLQPAERPTSADNSMEPSSADNNVAPLPVDNNMEPFSADNDVAPLAADNSTEPSSAASDDEAAQHKYYTEKYKLYPFVKLKSFLKQNKIPKGDVDTCLSKFELKKLAEKHGVAIPDDPKSLTADNSMEPTS